MNNIDSVIKQIAAACGIEEKNVIVDDLYLQWVLQPSYETIAVCGVLILQLYFSLLWSLIIFFRSVSNKIQEYGKIKALGATKKQMKQLIFREGFFLTIFSIPVGLLLGFLIAKCGFNWLVEQGNLLSTGTDSMGVPNKQVPLFYPACYTSMYFRIISYRCFGTAQTNENCFTDFTYRSNTVFRKCRNTQKRKTKWQKKCHRVFYGNGKYNG